MAFSSWGPCLGLLCLAVGCDAYANGAPLRQCAQMKPFHRPRGAPRTDPAYPPQTAPSPYAVTADKQTDQVINVKLNGTRTFKGFFVQARETTDLDKLVPGAFAFTGTETKTVDCSDIPNTAITHTSNVGKTEIIASWIGPASYNGSVIFRATVVAHLNTYWLGIYSNSFDIDMPVKRPPAQPAKLCGVTVSCLEMPSVGENFGRALLAYVADDTDILFELSISTTLDHMWVAAGLSKTLQMGSAHVVECLLNNGQVVMRESWNHDNRSNSLVTRPTPGLVFKKTGFTDGTLTCSWHRVHATTVQQTSFDTLKDSYHILMASGLFTPGTTEKRAHLSRIITSNRVDLKAVQTRHSVWNAYLLIRIHGSLMITSWVLFVSVGIFLARHFKNAWPAETLWDQEIWFALHRGLMLASVSMTVVALAIIFYRIGGWSSSKSLHPILGVISSTLGVLQPITAFFRCHPGDEKRYIFNWIHWMNGNVAHLTASTIFLATGLDKARLKNSAWFVYVLGAFLVFHVLVHTGMQVYSVATKKARSATDLMVPETGGPAADRDVAPIRNLAEPDPPTATSPECDFKRLALGIYMFFSTLVVASLLGIIWSSSP